MMKTQIPTFIDFEASSLGSCSYPIEVAWNIGDKIESHLIKPFADWTDWDMASEQIHGIPRSQIETEGEDGNIIANRMNEVLRGVRVFSDNALFDWGWCKVLFDKVRSTPEFIIPDSKHMITNHLLGFPEEMDISPGKLDFWQQQARERGGKRHRAANDVRYWVELWKIIEEERENYLKVNKE